MFYIFDSLTATIVGGVVLLMLFAIQSRIQSNTVESTIMFAAKTQALQLAEVLERDLANAGYMSTPNDPGIMSHSAIKVGGVIMTDTLEFWGSDGKGKATRVRYVLEEADVAVMDSQSVQLYQLKRYENKVFDRKGYRKLGKSRGNAGAMGWKLAGASQPTLKEFRIDLLDSASNGVVNIADSRKIRVRFESAVVGGRLKDTRGNTDRTFLRSLRWGATITPKGLALQSHQG